MLAKLLSENDLQITNFVTNLQKELALKEDTIKKLKTQSSAIEKDFLYNLSLLKERDNELSVLEQELENHQREIISIRRENSNLCDSLKEKTQDLNALKSSLKDQEEIYICNLERLEQEFKENSTVKSQQELILYEKIKELKQELSKKDQENCSLFHDFNQKSKNSQDKYLLELTTIRDIYEENLQQIKNKLFRKEERLQEMILLQEDMILQNNLKSKTIEGLDSKLLQFEQDKIKITQDSNVRIGDLESQILKIQENEKFLNYQLNQDQRETIRRLDEIIEGLSNRNEFLKRDADEKLSQKDAIIHELEVSNGTLSFKLEQEKSIKVSENELHLEREEKILKEIKQSKMDLGHFRERLTNVSSELERKNREVADLQNELANQIKEKEQLFQQLSNDGLNKENLLKCKERRISQLEKELDTLSLENQTLRHSKDDFEKKYDDLSRTLKNMDLDKTNRITELESTNEKLSLIIHQMRLDMEAIQDEFRGNNKSVEEISPTIANEPTENNLLKENSNLKNEINDLKSRIKRLAIEKNRLVDMSNSVRSHIRNLEESQENKTDRSTQTNITFNSLEAKDPNVSKDPKSLTTRQSDKETVSQNNSRLRLTKTKIITKGYINKSPDRLQSTRTFGIRNWNDRND